MNITIPEGCLPWEASIGHMHQYQLNFLNLMSYGFYQSSTGKITLDKLFPSGELIFANEFDSIPEMDKFVRKEISPIVEKNYKEWSKWLSLLTEYPTTDDQCLST